MDPVIAQAGENCGLDPQLIHSTFPSELTMWIDPLEVSYRIGENGSICVLYEYKEGCNNEPWKPNNVKTSSTTTTNNKNNSSSSNNNNSSNNSNSRHWTTTARTRSGRWTTCWTRANPSPSSNWRPMSPVAKRLTDE